MCRRTYAPFHNKMWLIFINNCCQIFDFAVCDMVEQGVSVIIGPDSPDGDEIVQTVSQKLQIPQFQPFWNPSLATFNKRSLAEDGYISVFNLYPENGLSTALDTLVRESQWKSYTIIYEDEDSLARLQDVLKSRKLIDLPVTIRQLDEAHDYR